MPEAGWNGWYSDWWNHGAGGDPGLGDLPHHRTAPAARTRLGRQQQPRRRGPVDGRPRLAPVRRPPPRHVPRGGGVLRICAPPTERRVGATASWASSEARAVTRSASGATPWRNGTSGKPTTRTTWRTDSSRSPSTWPAATAPPAPGPTRHDRRPRSRLQPPEPRPGGRPHQSRRQPPDHQLLRPGHPRLAVLATRTPLVAADAPESPASAVVGTSTTHTHKYLYVPVPLRVMDQRLIWSITRGRQMKRRILALVSAVAVVAGSVVTATPAQAALARWRWTWQLVRRRGSCR